MKAEVKQLWLAALRDGEYKQATGTLHEVDGDNHAFCCLGVLCDLAVKNGVAVAVQEVGGYVKYDGNGDTLPTSVQEWADLLSEDPHVSITDYIDEDDNDDVIDGSSSLSNLNDERKWSFSQIADAIEREL